LSGYYAYANGFEGQLYAKRSNLALAERLLRSCLESLRQGRSETLCTTFLTDLAEVLAKAGSFGESLAAATEVLQRTERHDAFWWMPEALRIKGEILMQSNPSDPKSLRTALPSRWLARADRVRCRGNYEPRRAWRCCGRRTDAPPMATRF
jgi:hypothetical protein